MLSSWHTLGQKRVGHSIVLLSYLCILSKLLFARILPSVLHLHLHVFHIDVLLLSMTLLIRQTTIRVLLADDICPYIICCNLWLLLVPQRVLHPGDTPKGGLEEHWTWDLNEQCFEVDKMVHAIQDVDSVSSQLDLHVFLLVVVVGSDLLDNRNSHVLLTAHRCIAIY